MFPELYTGFLPLESTHLKTKHFETMLGSLEMHLHI